MSRIVKDHRDSIVKDHFGPRAYLTWSRSSGYAVCVTTGPLSFATLGTARTFIAAFDQAFDACGLVPRWTLKREHASS